MDTSVKLSSMVVIDAKTMKEIGIARMPVEMGYGFHGIFILDVIVDLSMIFSNVSRIL